MSGEAPAISPPSPTLLFDLDGTIVDSQPGILASCRVALQTLGHTPDPSLDLTPLIGPPIEEGMSWLLARHGDDRVVEAVTAYRADYAGRGLFDTLAYAGMAEALAAMRTAGAQLIVATSKRTRFARTMLEHLGLADTFAAIHGSEEGGRFDHKTPLIGHIVERHGLDRHCCLMIGDRRFDIEGAHANGVRALGVLWGYGTQQELESAGADGLVPEPAALPAAVARGWEDTER
ncbi:MAG TPA: HAD hydrolase-like protein [Caulobacteraceae bacterium]|nr:HAD hydrolase-like protein [Caulobacteraceae bacterium]